MAFFGFDTETLDGYARVIATNIEYISVSNFSDIVTFISNKKYRGAIFWTWNLRYDVQAILKHLLKENEDNWREVTEEILGDGYTYTDKIKRTIKIKYIQSKKLSITLNKRTVNFYDIAQFYGHISLDRASKDYLGRQKEDYANWVEMSKEYQQGKYTNKEMKDYLFHNLDDVGEYCKLDADLTLNLANYMKQGFERAGIPFKKPLSQAKLAEEYIKATNNYPLPPEMLGRKIADYHEKVRYSFHGGIFETLQRGLFEEEIFDYDINSAYPKTMSTLPNWGNGEFKRVDTFSDHIKYGWYLCEFDCRWIPYVNFKENYKIAQLFDGEFEEVIASNYRIFYPTGKRVQFITRIELNFLIKHNFYYKVLGGIEWEQTKNKYESPFSWVEETYYKRAAIKKADKNDMRQYALKILLNSSYGKTAQQEPFRGDLTNFFYASYITADTRIKLAEVAEKHPKNVIDIATDGICLNKEVKGLEIDDTKLGAWDLSIFDKALFIGSGIRQMFTGDKYETYARGLTNNRQFNLLKEIEGNQDTDILYHTKARPLNLGECRSHTKTLTLDHLNIFTNVTKRLDVNTDKKHKWSLKYGNFGEFLQKKSFATPFTVTELEFN